MTFISIHYIISQQAAHIQLAPYYHPHASVKWFKWSDQWPCGRKSGHLLFYT